MKVVMKNGKKKMEETMLNEKIEKWNKIKNDLEEAARKYDKLVLSGREFDDELHKEIIDCVNEKSQLKKMEEQAYKEICENPEVGMYANMHGYTDVEPFEIVKVVSEKCIEVRTMKCEIDNWKSEVIVGGFSGHTVNNHSQKWKIEPNPEGAVVRIRKNKKGQWVNGSQKFYVSMTPVKFYDYNF